MSKDWIDETMDASYYRILVTKDAMVTVVEMSEFGEMDYNDNQFMYNEETGERLHFNNEEDAIVWLNANIDRKHIDRAYIRYVPSDFR